MFILSTYADSDRWTSAFEPLLYPCGLSFYRSFSYKDDYFYPSGVASELGTTPPDGLQLRDSDQNEGWFGIRFKQEHEGRFLKTFVPLRKVTLLAAERLDALNLIFKLGPYVVPCARTSGQEPGLPNLELTGILGDLTSTKLFIKLEPKISLLTSQWKVSDSFPSEFWPALERSLSPAALERAQNLVVLRLDMVRKRGEKEPLVPVALDRRTCAYKLRQLETYDLFLSHYRIRGAGSLLGAIDYQYQLSNPADELSASRRYISLMGNYRADSIWISPLNPATGPLEVAIEPRKLGTPDAIVDPSKEKILGLRVPIGIQRERWDGNRFWNAGLGLVFLAVCGYFFRRYLQATTGDSQKLPIAMITITVPLIVSYLKEAFIPGKK